MRRFWEEETPVELNTGANVFRHYPKAGFLMVCKPDYEKDGKAMPGKCVGVNLAALKESPDDLDYLLQTLEGLK